MDSDRPFVTFNDLMAKTGALLFHWSLLEQQLAESISEARRDLGEPERRLTGSFAERLAQWHKLACALPENADLTARADEVRSRALELKSQRNLIVHGLQAGRGTPKDGPAHIVCAIGGYDNPSGETATITMTELEDLTQAIDACRRAFRALATWENRLL